MVAPLPYKIIFLHLVLEEFMCCFLHCNEVGLVLLVIFVDGFILFVLIFACYCSLQLGWVLDLLHVVSQFMEFACRYALMSLLGKLVNVQVLHLNYLVYR